MIVKSMIVKSRMTVVSLGVLFILSVLVSLGRAGVSGPGIESVLSNQTSVPPQVSQTSSNSKTLGNDRTNGSISLGVGVAVSQGSGGYLGVYLGDLNEERAKELKLSEIRGAVIGKVEESSPAAKSGLLENDVILVFNDQRVQNRAHLYRLLIESSAGGKVLLGISRNGETRNIPIELGQRRTGVMDPRQRLFSEADAMLASAEDRRREAQELLQKGDEKGANKLLEEEKMFRKQSEEWRTAVEKQILEGKIPEGLDLRRPNYNVSAHRYFLGLTVVEISAQLVKFFNLTSGGVLVSEVRPGGGAEKAGIKAGDCIVAVNDEWVATPSDLNRLIERVGKGETGKGGKDSFDLTISIVRDRSEQKVTVKIETR
jgi:C-terminal processing protease CtpA/Prc